MKRAFFILAVWFLCAPVIGMESEIIPCAKSQTSEETPMCCLKRNDKEFLLLVGNKELKRYTHSLGANMIDAIPAHDNALKIALETLLLLRQTGVCK